MRKGKTTWTDLYNCLYLVSSNYKEISHLESPIFEIFDELDTRILLGLSEESLSFFISEGWINDELKREIAHFRDHLNNISPQHWNADDFDHFEDWNLARDWARSLMQRLQMKKTGWNSDREVVIYTK